MKRRTPIVTLGVLVVFGAVFAWTLRTDEPAQPPNSARPRLIVLRGMVFHEGRFKECHRVTLHKNGDCKVTSHGELWGAATPTTRSLRIPDSLISAFTPAVLTRKEFAESAGVVTLTYYIDNTQSRRPSCVRNVLSYISKHRRQR